MNARGCGIFLIIVIVICVTTISSNENDSGEARVEIRNRNLGAEFVNSVTVEPRDPTVAPEYGGTDQKWITQLFLEAESHFRMDATVSEDCRSDFQLYRNHLQNQSEWAVRSKFRAKLVLQFL